ncbi:MAG: autotransporter outer membrane beta-barrel domain-containing protein [Rhodanobacter sp.]
MNTNTSGRPNKTSHPTTFAVTPVTGAIRAALAISFTLLALGGSSAVFAQSCVFTAPATETCEGAFTGTLPDPAFFTPVADLTLVLGDGANSVPTTVNPAAGLMGIDASWGGDVGVTSYADITTEGADGIFASSTSTATVVNQGSVTTDVTAIGAKAIDVTAYGDISVVNNGAIDAHSTGVYDVTAVSAYSIHGKVSVDNQSLGTIAASAQDGNAIALYASAYGDSVVSNEGTIAANSANGVAAGAIASAFLGDASFTNSGSISATATNYQAVGLIASSTYGSATVANLGMVTVTGGQDRSIGISSSAAIDSTIENSGSVHATSSQGGSTGLSAQSESGIARVTNSGMVLSGNSGPDTAIGVLASSVNGQAAIVNSGFVQSINHGGAGIGLEADSAAGSTISNSSYVLGGSYFDDATGLLATATSGDVAVTNGAAGYVRTVSNGTSSYLEAIGVSAHSIAGKVTVDNDGSILAQANVGKANGIQAFAGGDVYVGNTGGVRALNITYNDARGISALSYNGAATVVNSGSVYGGSSPQVGLLTDKTTVDGIVAVSRAGAFDAATNTYAPTAIAAVVNSGKVYAAGAWFVNGIAAGSYGGTSVTNTASGAIVVQGLQVAGISVVELPNSKADYGQGVAAVDNAGSISVAQVGDCYCNGVIPTGFGIRAVSSLGGDIAVANSGSIAINTQHNGIGVYGYGLIGETTASNSGDIVVSGAGINGAQLFGEEVLSAYGGVSASNSGKITILSPPVAGQHYAGSQAEGMFARAGRAGSSVHQGGGDAILVNTGQIDIDSTIGYGMWTNSQYGVAQASNAGDITLNDDFAAVGVTATAGNNRVYGVGSVVLGNTGSVSATASNQAIGLRSFTAGAPFAGNPGITVAIDNSGYVGVSSQQRSQGILAFSSHDDAFTINNSGSIVAHATPNNRTGEYAGASAFALGVHTVNYNGGAIVTNSGDITVVTQEANQRAGAAAAIFADSGMPTRYLKSLGITYGDTSITNTGSISASLASSNTLPPNPPDPHRPIVSQSLAGPLNTASGILAASTYGDVAIGNAGAISATAQSDHYVGGGVANGVTTANGIAVTSNVGNYNFTTTYSYEYIPGKGWTKVYNGVASSLSLGDIKLTNSAVGTLSAYAKSTDATADTAMANGISAAVTIGNYGGSLVSADTGITIDNVGAVSATAVIANDASGMAIANGISAINGSTEGFVHLTSSGHVAATATGPNGTATGMLASGAIVTGDNAGFINATFNGSGGIAYGAMITSAGDLSFSNSGHIVASNAVHAVGVDLVSPTTVTLDNSGTITADATATGSLAVVATGAANATITNTGTINGAIHTGDGDDIFTNAIGAVWNVVGSSDFGAGDDVLTNAGTINLSSAKIALGSYNKGNLFGNAGLINVVGANTIAMGAGATTNPNAFPNNGVLNFHNGVAGDTLVITGDFSGTGTLNMDVSGLHGTGDQLNITGNVLAGSVNTVNVHVLDDPTKASTIIPLVTVTGTSAAGSFKLGTVVQDKSFLELSNVLLTDLDPSNATSDVFALGQTVTPPVTPPITPPVTPPVKPPVTPPPVIGIGESVNGLSNLGTLAVSAAPGAQSLMNSQIGTLEQRMGAVGQTLKGGVSLWARVFGDSGTLDPSHNASNFGQGGNFAFEQNNSGEEVGIDFAFTDEFKGGLLVAKDQANQHLVGSNSGSSSIRGTTGGLYATWISANGTYLDASFRSMNFTSHLKSAKGEAWVKGDADAFNVEAGKRWTFGNGVQIAPQLQYTWSRVNGVKSVSETLAGFRSSGDDSSRGRLGVMISKSYTTTGAGILWTPYVTVSAVREFNGTNRYTINNTFRGETSTQGTSALVEAGANVKIRNLALYGGASWQDGGAMKSFFGGQVGVRYTW